MFIVFGVILLVHNSLHHLLSTFRLVLISYLLIRSGFCPLHGLIQLFDNIWIKAVELKWLKASETENMTFSCNDTHKAS